jgi:sporulation protein YlmC with PRC-barrel domain
MHTLNRVGYLGAVAILAAIPLLPLAAQTLPPASKPEAQSKIGPTILPPARNPLVGLGVFSSDGNKVGTVDSVDGQPDGKITAVNIRTGGFLGFGTRVVAIPEGKFQRAGAFVQVGMTVDELNKLPALRDQN